MGKLLSNPRKRLARIRLAALDYKGLIALGGSIQAALTGNPSYATPIPTLINLATAISNVKSAAALHGSKRNKGSHSNFETLKANTITLRNMIQSEINYITTTAGTNASDDSVLFNSILATAGTGLRHVKAKIKRAQPVTFIRQTNNKLYPPGVHRINWKKSQGFIKGYRINQYEIVVGGVFAGTTTKGNFIVTVPVGGSVDVIVTPFNSFGRGQSMFITVK